MIPVWDRKKNRSPSEMNTEVQSRIDQLDAKVQVMEQTIVTLTQSNQLMYRLLMQPVTCASVAPLAPTPVTVPVPLPPAQTKTQNNTQMQTQEQYRRASSMA